MGILIEQTEKYLQTITLKKDGSILRLPIYKVDHFFKVDEFLSKCLVSWKLVRVGEDIAMRQTIYTKRQWRAFIIRSYLFLENRIYWRFFIWWFLLRKLKLIECPESECFSWKDHFRPLKWLIEGDAVIR